jgi:SAM-dependent methyltransferase
VPRSSQRSRPPTRIDLGRTEPLSRSFGGDRGTPLDRYYIEGFLSRHAADIRGRVLEIGESLYTEKHGGDRVSEAVILDAPGSDNPNADIVADLASGRGVPSRRFDCLILTQTLHMIYDVRGVLKTVHRCLKPGGVCLATVPGISAIDAQDGPDKWFWLMTQTAARLLFEERFRPEDVTVEVRGNVMAATAFLQGVALEEVERGKLDVEDALYPVITGIRAVKAA